jgi:hypothetical protein
MSVIYCYFLGMAGMDRGLEQATPTSVGRLARATGQSTALAWEGALAGLPMWRSRVRVCLVPQVFRILSGG